MQSYADRKGAHSITFGDQSITFESWDDIWRWLQTMQGQIVGRTTSRYAATSKGF